MAQICHSYSQNLSLLLFMTCPVSYHSSTLGHIDKEYLKIPKNGQKMGKNGPQITPFRQLQANYLQITPFGWSKTEDAIIQWTPLWLTTKEATRECREFVKCTCSQVCTRCKCKQASFKCTLLCTCKCSDKVLYET